MCMDMYKRMYMQPVDMTITCIYAQPFHCRDEVVSVKMALAIIFRRVLKGDVATDYGHASSSSNLCTSTGKEKQEDRG